MGLMEGYSNYVCSGGTIKDDNRNKTFYDYVVTGTMEQICISTNMPVSLSITTVNLVSKT